MARSTIGIPNRRQQTGPTSRALPAKPRSQGPVARNVAGRQAARGTFTRSPIAPVVRGNVAGRVGQRQAVRGAVKAASGVPARQVARGTQMAKKPTRTALRKK